MQTFGVISRLFDLYLYFAYREVIPICCSSVWKGSLTYLAFFTVKIACFKHWRSSPVVTPRYCGKMWRYDQYSSLLTAKYQLVKLISKRFVHHSVYNWICGTGRESEVCIRHVHLPWKVAAVHSVCQVDEKTRDPGYKEDSYNGEDCSCDCSLNYV